LLFMSFVPVSTRMRLGRCSRDGSMRLSIYWIVLPDQAAYIDFS
jgi:hypothetical protein